MFGGADPGVANLVPSDIEILRNHLHKPLSWRSYSGWVVKNNLELKNAQRVRIEGNVLENNWADASGMMVILMGVNQEGAAPWSVVQDITFRYNILTNAPGGLGMMGRYDGNNVLGKRFLIAQNLFTKIGDPALGGENNTMAMSEGYDVTVENNTIQGTKNAFMAYGARGGALSYRNNLVALGRYGWWGDAVGGGTTALNAYFTPWTFSGNVIWDLSDPTGYPTGTQTASSIGAVGFVSWSTGNWRLSASSPYLTAGTGGSRPGVDMDQLEQRTAGVKLQ